MSVESWLTGIWYSRRAAPWWLKAPALLYGAVVTLRRTAYLHGWARATRLARPVIVVGNLSVGGTGKTPLVCWLVERLRELGHAPGVVTRGYGGSARGVRIVAAGDDPGRVGDEPVLIARRAGAPVAIGRNRPAAAQLLVNAGCDVIVSDDGLQHYALARDCEILVIDGERRFGNGWLLPAGPLRERPSRTRSVDAVVVNGAHAPRDEGLAMRLEAHEAVALSGARRVPLAQFAGRSVHAVAGIGNPQRFFNMLRALGIRVTGHALADHARLSRSDIVFADDNPVLMTEKDAVKCAGEGDERHWYVPVGARFDPQEAGALLAIVARRLAGRVPPQEG